jgi:hypothetical protein
LVHEITGEQITTDVIIRSLSFLSSSSPAVHVRPWGA